MTVKAEFVISAKDRTREAIAGVKKNLEGLERTGRMLRYAFSGYIFAEFLRSVTDTEIKLQSMEYTLLAATGSMGGARQEMSFLIDTADKLGLSITDLGQYYARMAAIATDSGYSLKQFRQEFVNISGAMRVLHLDQRHTQYAWLAIQEIMSQGTVKMRHLTRQLSIDFPTALQAAALGMGKTTGQLMEMAHAGTLASHVFLEGLSKGLKQMYGPEVQSAANGLQADLARVGNAFTEAVDKAQNTGAFDEFGQAMNSLAATLKDPAFQHSFGEFLADLAKVANFSASGFKAWMNGVDILAQKLNGLSTVGYGKMGNTLSDQLANAVKQAKQLRDLSEKPLGLFSHHQRTKYNGQWYNLTQKQMNRWETLSILIRNLRRIQAEGPQAVANYNKSMSASTADHHKKTHKIAVEHFSKTQQSALNSLTSIQSTLEKKLTGLQSKIAQARELMKAFKPGTSGYSEANAIVKEIAADQKRLDILKKQKDFRKQLESQTKKNFQQEIKHEAALMKEADKWRNILHPVDKYKQELQQINAAYKAGYLSASDYQKAAKKITDETKKPFGAMNQYAVQAARSIQSDFANFLFDPFKNGLKGMLSNFVDMIRKMIAQYIAMKALMAAGKALSKEGGWVGAIGSVLSSLGKGSGHALGGPVNSGTVYPVGENGPELFMPTQNGKIIPNSAMSGAGHRTTVNIDARGAGPDEVAKLAMIAKNVREGARNDILHFHQYGAFPAS